MSDRPTALCADAAFGSYENQVSMNPPASLELRGPISIDLCLASEIAGLWARGIRTVSSCCGHGRLRSYIGVSSWDSTVAMVALGYERDDRNLEIFAFTTKSGCELPPATEGDEPEGADWIALHRACINEEHDPENGKLSGFCVRCGQPWPCQYSPESALTAEPPAQEEKP